MSKNYLKSIAVTVGSTIGVGMFGLPFLVSKAGVISFLLLLAVFSMVQHFQHLVFADLVISNHGFHRLPGYAEKYIGKGSKKLAAIAQMVGSYGALLAYVVLMGVFLNQLLNPYFGGNEMTYGIIALLVHAAVIYLGMGMMASAELLMGALLFATIAMISVRGAESLSVSNLVALDWKNFLLPYGAVLFAVDGISAVPIVVSMLKKQEQKIRSVLTVSMFICFLAISLFALVVVGVSGQDTSPDALTGLRNYFSDGVLTIALLCGILTMATSFLGVAESLNEMFMWDYKIGRSMSFFLTLGVPFLFYAAGLNDFIEIISFAGAISGGISAILLLLIYLEKKKRKKFFLFSQAKPNRALIYFLVAIFIGGMFYEVFHYLK